MSTLVSLAFITKPESTHSYRYLAFSNDLDFPPMLVKFAFDRLDHTGQRAIYKLDEPYDLDSILLHPARLSSMHQQLETWCREDSAIVY